MGADDPALDDVTEAVRTITDLLTHVNLIGIDFSDIRAFCLDPDGLRGRAFFGEGEAKGEPNGGRAMWAAEAALHDLKRRRDSDSR